MDICSETEEGSGFGWESLWSGLFLDLAGEWAQLRSAAVSAMEGVAAGMHRRQEALAVCVADLQKAVQQVRR